MFKRLQSPIEDMQKDCDSLYLYRVLTLKRPSGVIYDPGHIYLFTVFYVLISIMSSTVNLFIEFCKDRPICVARVSKTSAGSLMTPGRSMRFVTTLLKIVLQFVNSEHYNQLFWVKP